ncbi:MAG: glycosyltransferase family 2 protein [Chloroflexi bacterium]|nr:glycosyltransferase family 2 protein [Chloroflexota bacterium]
MRFSVVVLVWNGARFLDACLRALLDQDASAEIVVVDNASTDDSVSIVQKFVPRVCLVRNDHNLGFAGGNNIGIRATTGEIVVLLNQDTAVKPGWLRAIADTFADPGIGIVGCKALYPDGRGIQHAGGVVQPATAWTHHIGWGEQDQGQYDTLTEPDYVTGAAFGIRRQVLERLGGLDEKFHPAFYEEVDCCYRARRAGFRVVYQPRAVLDHYETATLPAASHARVLAYHRNRVRFVLRHWNARELAEFFSAEHRAIEIAGLIDDMVAYSRAYWDNLLAYPLIASQRKNDSTLGARLTRGESRHVIESLQSLRQLAHSRVAALIMRQSALAQQKVSAPEYLPVLQSALPETIDLAGLYTHIEDLENQSALKLPRSNSHVPVVGRVIDACLDFWARQVMRYYLEPVLRQQTIFNLRTFRGLATLMRATDALSRLQQLDSMDEASVADAMLAMLDHAETSAERSAK